MKLTLIAGTLFFCLIGASSAQEPALETALAALGYPAESYSVVFHWQERAAGIEDVYVDGCRLAPQDGGPAFDIYWDEEGAELDAAALASLGIRPKNWTPRVVSQAAEIHPGYPKASVAAPPTPVSPGIYPAIPELGLEPPDLAKAAMEDEAGSSTPSKDVARIGVFIDLPQSVEVVPGRASEGAWYTAPDGGSVWALSLRSLGALGMRVHFDAIAIPEGAQVVVYNADDPAETYGPFANGEEVWTPTCFGEAVIAECYLPAKVRAEGLYLSIDRVTHQYKSLTYLEKEAAGTCNLDVTCYPAWQTTALGVGGLGTIGDEGSLWCTGSLIADGDPTSQIPYFLTANHCVPGSRSPSTVEVYWLYQRESCGGILPEADSVPRTTGGATLIAATDVGTGSDFSLLRLKNAPPDGLVYLGWTTESIPYNTDVTVIHHPKGDYKRISFGEKVNSGSPSNNYLPRYSRDRFHEVLWSEGTTEGGSSGSPLVLTETHQIIGQLYGGHASCYKPEEPDYFGRFDWTYPLVESYLGAVASPYDVDEDGDIDEADLQLVIDAALHRSTLSGADVDGSGHVDATDIQSVANAGG